jgi:hypothetical protein
MLIITVLYVTVFLEIKEMNMNVKELKKILSNYDDETEVCLFVTDGDARGHEDDAVMVFEHGPDLCISGPMVGNEFRD